MLFAAQRRLSFGISNLLAIHFFSVEFMFMRECIVQYYISRCFENFSIHPSRKNCLTEKIFLLVINFLPLDYGSLVCSSNF